MISFDEVRERYAAEIERTLNEFFKRSADSTGKAMAEMSVYHFETGGKRLRALIPIYVYETFGRNGADLVPFGAAVEMIHNATLVHDDLQDGDEYRRNRPTVWKKWSSAQAINCGDAMFQYAFQLMGDLKIDDRLKLRMYQHAATATLKVIEGQAQEFIMKEEGHPGLDRYLEVIRGKTSGLFALPVVGALEAAGVNSDICRRVEAAAMDLGVLFQVQDDVLDLYGDKGRDQKATDIAEGKISYFVACVNELGSQQDREALGAILKKPRRETTPRDIETALEIFDRCECKGHARRYLEKIRDRIEHDAALRAEAPGVHRILVQLGDQFLKPIKEVLYG